MDLSRQESNANTRGGPPGWHPRESDSRAFQSHRRGNVRYLPKSDEVPRVRTVTTDGPGLLPNPDYFPTNSSYPPGFDNSHRSPPSFDDSHMSPLGIDNGYRNAPGFDNNHRNRSGFDDNNRNRPSLDSIYRNRSGFDNSPNYQGEMMFQESPETTSDRSFLSQRIAPPGGPSVTNSTDQIPRGDNRGVKVEFCGPSQNRPPSVAVKDCNAPEASKGGPIELLANVETKKRKKLGAEDAQPANDYERATKVCHKLWKDLDFAIEQRERDLREKEDSYTPSTINKEVLEEEKKQTAALKDDIMEERRRLEEEAQRIRKEKDAMERTSTELAVQMVELKQVQRQFEKKKAALLAQKAELSAKERCLH